jgi:DNA-binding response OmpR family regulator
VDEPSYVKRYIWYLRQKVEDDPASPRYIETVRGFGYRLGKG